MRKALAFVAIAGFAFAGCGTSASDEATVTVTKTPSSTTDAPSSTTESPSEGAPSPVDDQNGETAAAPQGGSAPQSSQSRYMPTIPEPIPTLPLDALDEAVERANGGGYVPPDTNGDANIFATDPALAGGGADPTLPDDAGAGQAGY